MDIPGLEKSWEASLLQLLARFKERQTFHPEMTLKEEEEEEERCVTVFWFLRASILG